MICDFTSLLWLFEQDTNQRQYYQEHGRPMLVDYVQLEMEKKAR